MQEISLERRKPLYFAYVHSHLTYLLFVWGSSSRTSDLQIIQNKCIKALYGLPYRTPTKYLSANLMPVMRKYDRILHIHKMVNGFTKHNFPLHRIRDIHINIQNPSQAYTYVLDINTQHLNLIKFTHYFSTKTQSRVRKINPYSSKDKLPRLPCLKLHLPLTKIGS